MPVAVLTIVFAIAMPSRIPAGRALGIVLLLGVAVLVPSRLRAAAMLHRLPQYGRLVEATGRIARRGEPMRAIQTDFVLPPSCDPSFLFTIRGGRLQRGAPWYAVISEDGRVTYHHVTD